MTDSRHEEHDDPDERSWLEYMEFNLRLGVDNPQLREYTLRLTEDLIRDVEVVANLLKQHGYNADLSVLAQTALRGFVDSVAEAFEVQLPSQQIN